MSNQRPSNTIMGCDYVSCHVMMFYLQTTKCRHTQHHCQFNNSLGSSSLSNNKSSQIGLWAFLQFENRAALENRSIRMELETRDIHYGTRDISFGNICISHCFRSHPQFPFCFSLRADQTWVSQIHKPFSFQAFSIFTKCQNKNKWLTPMTNKWDLKTIRPTQLQNNAVLGLNRNHQPGRHSMRGQSVWIVKVLHFQSENELVFFGGWNEKDGWDFCFLFVQKTTNVLGSSRENQVGLTTKSMDTGFVGPVRVSLPWYSQELQANVCFYCPLRSHISLRTKSSKHVFKQQSDFKRSFFQWKTQGICFADTPVVFSLKQMVICSILSAQLFMNPTQSNRGKNEVQQKSSDPPRRLQVSQEWYNNATIDQSDGRTNYVIFICDSKNHGMKCW